MHAFIKHIYKSGKSLAVSETEFFLRRTNAVNEKHCFLEYIILKIPFQPLVLACLGLKLFVWLLSLFCIQYIKIWEKIDCDWRSPFCLVVHHCVVLCLIDASLSPLHVWSILALFMCFHCSFTSSAMVKLKCCTALNAAAGKKKNVGWHYFIFYGKWCSSVSYPKDKK